MPDNERRPPTGLPPGTYALEAVRPARPPPVFSRPTELILDFSAPGQDTRRPLTRRGHVKSRLGCLSCKRRRVKCDETHPVCGQCGRLKLSCSYPPKSRRQAQNEGQQQQQLQPAASSSSSSGSQLALQRQVGSALNLDHLAFYHQFLTVAYPTTPIKEQSAWADVTAMSHHYEYLAHAVLGLGASHLTANTGADYTAYALHHRTIAMRLVNERLGQPIETSAEGDAIMGALLCLCGQSSLITDSVHEYVAIARGTYLVSQAIVLPLGGSLFKTITDSRHLNALLSIFEEQPNADYGIMAEFRDSIGALITICHQDHELQYQELLYSAVAILPKSPFDAVKCFVALFVLPSCFDSAAFADFVREGNHTGHLLMAHMFLLDYMIGHTCFPEREIPKCGGRKDIVIAWVRKTMRRLPAELRIFGDFPLKYCDCLAIKDSRNLFWP